MKMDAPKPDPALQAEQKRAQNERIVSLQDRLGQDTSQLARLFGAAGKRRSLAGGSSRPGIAGGA